MGGRKSFAQVPSDRQDQFRRFLRDDFGLPSQSVLKSLSRERLWLSSLAIRTASTKARGVSILKNLPRHQQATIVDAGAFRRRRGSNISMVVITLRGRCQTVGDSGFDSDGREWPPALGSMRIFTWEMRRHKGRNSRVRLVHPKRPSQSFPPDGITGDNQPNESPFL